MGGVYTPGLYLSTLRTTIRLCMDLYLSYDNRYTGYKWPSVLNLGQGLASSRGYIADIPACIGSEQMYVCYDSRTDIVLVDRRLISCLVN